MSIWLRQNILSETSNIKPTQKRRWGQVWFEKTERSGKVGLPRGNSTGLGALHSFTAILLLWSIPRDSSVRARGIPCGVMYQRWSRILPRTVLATSGMYFSTLLIWEMVCRWRMGAWLAREQLKYQDAWNNPRKIATFLICSISWSVKTSPSCLERR